MLSKDIHLVLGSGGARGLAHFGVIDCLRDHGYNIISVSGCSMGAVVGGIYAAGYHNEYKEWMCTLSRSRVFTLLDFTIDRLGFIKGERIFDVINEFIDVPDIQDFNIPFTAVAADIASNNEVWFQSGNLYRALRASIAIPGVFTPLYDGERILVDGGIINPLPLNTVKKKSSESIIAVNLNGVIPYKRESSFNIIEEHSMLDDLKSWLNLYPDDNPIHHTSSNQDKKLSDFLLYSYQMTQDKIVDLMIKRYEPDLVIEFPRTMCNTFDFHMAQELIDRGYKKCEKLLHKWVTSH
jgi:NTE family protein